MSKSAKLRLAAKLVGFIGCLACLIGGVVYYVLTLPEIMGLPFELLYLIIDGAAFVVIAAVSISLAIAAKSIDRRAARKAEAEAAAIAAAEAAEAEAKALALAEAEAAFAPENECCLECDFAETCDYLADEKARFIEAYLAEPTEEEALAEDAEEVEEEPCVNVCCPMMMAQAEAEEASPCEKITADVRQAIDKAIVAVKENAVKIAIPVAAACVATLMVAKAKKNKKRKVELKRMKEQAKFRQDFYKWLG